MPEPLLQVNNLKMYFPVRSGIFLRQAGWVKAVDDVSFNIYPAKRWGWWGNPAAENPPSAKASCAC